ncbi:MAG: hypothetical protein IJ058_00090 [Lachnospiraceae bacterium]|nr:hypothetical protein [Lachnospiraceae bacterium]
MRKLSQCDAGVAEMRDICHELKDMRYLNWAKTKHSSGTAGSFLKSYDDTGYIKKYYKLSDYAPGKGIVGHECINEIIVQRLLGLLGIEHLEYRLIHAIVTIDDEEHETWLCESDDYKNKGESKLALEDFYAAYRVSDETPFDFCVRMGWGDIICDMLVLDYLILNRDRHGANIEVLRDRKSRKNRLSPLFDHGLSLMCRCRTEEDILNFNVMEDKRVQSFIGTNSALENLTIVPRDHIRNLINSHKMTDKTEDVLLTGISEIMSEAFCHKIWEMISGRWNFLGSI